jgi:hypothetical protein
MPMVTRNSSVGQNAAVMEYQYGFCMCKTTKLTGINHVYYYHVSNQFNSCYITSDCFV